MPAVKWSVFDLKKAVLRHCGEVDDGTSFYDQNGQILDYLNKAHASILGGGNEFDFELSKPWSWAVSRDPGVIVLQPAFNDGSVTVTANVNTVTFSTPPAFSLVGYRLQVLGRPDYIRITAHTASSATATLDAPYSDQSGAGLPFRCILTDYVLNPTPNGILRLTNAMTVFQPQDLQSDAEHKIYFLDENSMDRDYPMVLILNGTPGFYTITYKDPLTNLYYVRFNKVVDRPTRVEYKFIAVPDALRDSTSAFPLLPVEHREAVAFAAAYFLLTDKNDDRAQTYFQLTQQKLRAMQKAEEKQKMQTSKTRGKLIPRLDIYQRGKRFVTQETS